MLNKILSVFNRAITRCSFCPSFFRGSLQAGDYWLNNIHTPNCLEYKRLIRQAKEFDSKRWSPEALAEQNRTGYIPGQQSIEIRNP